METLQGPVMNIIHITLGASFITPYHTLSIRNDTYMHTGSATYILHQVDN